MRSFDSPRVWRPPQDDQQELPPCPQGEREADPGWSSRKHEGARGCSLQSHENWGLEGLLGVHHKWEDECQGMFNLRFFYEKQLAFGGTLAIVIILVRIKLLIFMIIYNFLILSINITMSVFSNDCRIVAISKLGLGFVCQCGRSEEDDWSEDPGGVPEDLPLLLQSHLWIPQHQHSVPDVWTFRGEHPIECQQDDCQWRTNGWSS